jgi:hypothetical protein
VETKLKGSDNHLWIPIWKSFSLLEADVFLIWDKSFQHSMGRMKEILNNPILVKFLLVYSLIPKLEVLTEI